MLMGMVNKATASMCSMQDQENKKRAKQHQRFYPTLRLYKGGTLLLMGRIKRLGITKESPD